VVVFLPPEDCAFLISTRFGTGPKWWACREKAPRIDLRAAEAFGLLRYEGLGLHEECAPFFGGGSCAHGLGLSEDAALTAIGQRPILSNEAWARSSLFRLGELQEPLDTTAVGFLECIDVFRATF